MLSSKKFNRSQQLHFPSTNSLHNSNYPPHKLTLKKSLPVLSPKTSSSKVITSTKNFHKPKKPSRLTTTNAMSMSSIPEIRSCNKIEAGNGNVVRRSRSKVIITCVNGEKEKQKEKLKQKDKWRNQQVTQDKTEYPKKILTARELRKNEEKQEDEGQISEQNRYQILLGKCKKVLKNYSVQLKKAHKEIEMLKEENNMLRKKNGNNH